MFSKINFKPYIYNVAVEGDVREVSNVVELDIILDEAKKNNALVMLDTYATWCGPCKVIAPFYAGLSVNPAFKSWVTFVKTDIDVAEDIAKDLDVRSMPTFFLFHHGKVVGIVSGANTGAIIDLLDKHKHLVTLE